MLGSRVLEVAIGLVFSFASISIVSSSVYEAIASMLGLRANTLLVGVKQILSNETWLIRSIYDHALVNPRSVEATPQGQDPKVKPSYIDPKNFAIAVIDALQAAPGDFKSAEAKIDAIQNAQVKSFLKNTIARAQGDVDKVRDELARWFDDGMSRVSGAYKRMAQLWTFVIALSVAALFNLDTFHMAATLWQQLGTASALAEKAASMSDPATLKGDAAIDALKLVPAGWPMVNDHLSLPHGTEWWVLAFLGWFVTATSVLFGAPFWFDLLQGLVNLRGTGDKPGEKKD